MSRESRKTTDRQQIRQVKRLRLLLSSKCASSVNFSLVSRAVLPALNRPEAARSIKACASGDVKTKPESALPFRVQTRITLSRNLHGAHGLSSNGRTAQPIRCPGNTTLLRLTNRHT